MEAFRDIKGYENLYQISNKGNVRSLLTNKILIGGTDLQGYKIVTLRKDKKNHTKTVHRLVAQAFLPNPNKLPCVNHKDENKQNNVIDNLEWCSYSYNLNYGSRTIRKNRKTVYQYDKEGNLLNVYSGVCEAAKINGISAGNLTFASKHKKINGDPRTIGGYIWKIK